MACPLSGAQRDWTAAAAAGWAQVRNFYGLPTEQYHQFAAAWHAGGRYIMAAAAHGWVYVFHVGSAKVGRGAGGGTLGSPQGQRTKWGRSCEETGLHWNDR